MSTDEAVCIKNTSLDLGLLVLQYLHFLIFSAFSHEKTGTR